MVPVDAVAGVRQSQSPARPPKRIAAIWLPAATVENDQCCDAGDRCTLPVRAQGARHSPDGLGDDGDRDELQPMQQAQADRTVERVRAVREQQQRNG